MLTDSKIRNLKAKDKAYRIADTKGLCLDIRPTGTKIWRYRFFIDKKERILTLGEYPAMGLAQARQKHLEARDLLKQGIDIVAYYKEQAKKQSQERQDIFIPYAEDFLQKLTGKRSSGYLRQIRYNLDTYIFPSFGKKPIKEIDTVDVIHMMRCVVEMVANNPKRKGTGEVTAELCRQQAGLIFRHAMRSVRGLHDPTIAAKGEIERPPIDHARDLTLDELKSLMTKLSNYGGMPSTKGVIWTMLYTMCRTKEARFMRWEHIDFERQLWIIPLAKVSKRRAGERNMKTDKPHIVPLSTQMMTLIESMYKISGLGEFVFAGTKNPALPIGAVTVNSALKYMGLQDISGHDLRSTGSTYLHGMGYDTQHINLQMAHVDNTVSGIYNHALWLPERTTMMQAWADYLDSLK